MKTFEVKLTDARTPMNVGDVVVVEEADSNGNASGATVARKASYILNTKEAAVYSPEDVAAHGLTVIGFVNPEYGTLLAVFDNHFVMSLGIDVRGDPEEGEEDDFDEQMPDQQAFGPDGWKLSAGPHYTPALLCPPIAESGMVENLKVGTWPSGRYSVTLMVYVDYDEQKGPPFEMHVMESLVMAYTADANDRNGVSVAMLDLDALMADGKAIDAETYEKVEPLDLHEFGLRMMAPIGEDDAHEHDLLTEGDLWEMIEGAEERGEDMSEMRQQFLELHDPPTTK
jgi:hypothetical protein